MRFKPGRVLVLLLLLALPNIDGYHEGPLSPLAPDLDQREFGSTKPWGMTKSKWRRWKASIRKAQIDALKWPPKRNVPRFPIPPIYPPPPTTTTTQRPYKGGVTDWLGKATKVWLICPTAKSKEQYIQSCTEYVCNVGCARDRSRTVSSTWWQNCLPLFELLAYRYKYNVNTNVNTSVNTNVNKDANTNVNTNTNTFTNTNTNVNTNTNTDDSFSVEPII